MASLLKSSSSSSSTTTSTSSSSSSSSSTGTEGHPTDSLYAHINFGQDSEEPAELPSDPAGLRSGSGLDSEGGREEKKDEVKDGKPKPAPGPTHQASKQRLQETAERLLVQINTIRADLAYKPWPANEQTREFALKHVPLDPDLCFSSAELTQIRSIEKAVSDRFSEEKVEKKKVAKRRRSPSKEHRRSPSEEGERSDSEPSSDIDDSTEDWIKAPISAELKSRMPPNWFGPGKEYPAESEKSRLLREKEAPKWAAVPLLPDEEARKKLVRTNTFRVSKGCGAGMTLPRPYDPKNELVSIKGKKGKLESLLDKILRKEIPACIARDTEVIRVLITLLNSWSTSDSDDIFTSLNEVLLPLLLDNNIRSTDVLQRLAFKLAHDVLVEDDDGHAVSTSSSSHLMRRFIDSQEDKAKVLKSLKKAKGSSSSSSSSSSSRGKFKRGGSSRPFGGGRGSGWSKSSPSEGGGGRGARKPARGSHSNRGGRGGNSSRSTSSSGDKSSI